jgi:hypothetical protein
MELEVVDSIDIETVHKTLKKRAQTLAEAMLVQNPRTLTDRRVFMPGNDRNPWRAGGFIG